MIKLKHLTRKERQELLRNESKWPVCGNCKRKISPYKYRRKRKCGKYTMRYFDWLKAKYCCRECGWKATAKAHEMANNNTPHKYCSVCSRRFYQTPDISKQRWHSIRNCPEHRHQQKVTRFAFAGFDDTKGKAVQQGFYVFSMPDYEKQTRRNPSLNGLLYTDAKTRDEIVDRICQELQK